MIGHSLIKEPIFWMLKIKINTKNMIFSKKTKINYKIDFLTLLHSAKLISHHENLFLLYNIHFLIISVY